MTAYNFPRPLDETQPGGWILQLTCCGRDDGTWSMPTWEEADKFREDYLNAGGHKRSAIIIVGFGPEDDPRDR